MAHTIASFSFNDENNNPKTYYVRRADSARLNTGPFTLYDLAPAKNDNVKVPYFTSSDSGYSLSRAQPPHWWNKMMSTDGFDYTVHNKSFTATPRPKATTCAFSRFHFQAEPCFDQRRIRRQLHDSRKRPGRRRPPLPRPAQILAANCARGAPPVILRRWMGRIDGFPIQRATVFLVFAQGSGFQRQQQGRLPALYPVV